MTLQPTSQPPTSTQPPVPSDVKKTLPTVNAIQIMQQSNMEELTPLQRQRLDAAVMLLVNYLVSASSAP
jgi:hypothetical protein